MHDIGERAQVTGLKTPRFPFEPPNQMRVPVGPTLKPVALTTFAPETSRIVCGGTLMPPPVGGVTSNGCLTLTLFASEIASDPPVPRPVGATSKVTLPEVALQVRFVAPEAGGGLGAQAACRVPPLDAAVAVKVAPETPASVAVTLNGIPTVAFVSEIDAAT